VAKLEKKSAQITPLQNMCKWRFLGFIPQLNETLQIYLFNSLNLVVTSRNLKVSHLKKSKHDTFLESCTEHFEVSL
jgi:hypothetical protein